MGLVVIFPFFLLCLLIFWGLLPIYVNDHKYVTSETVYSSQIFQSYGYYFVEHTLEIF